ncbi:MAG TPA: Uma2 family endonuclease [Acidobacteriaceae bacterium]
MTASTLVTMNEYLRTSYRPDVEYIDGELREKDGILRERSARVQWIHSRLQVMISAWFDQHEEEWGVLTGVEARTQVSASRVRLPDVVVVKAGPHPQTLVEPPLIVVEVLSPDDTYAEIERRAQDYLHMGLSMSG